MAYPHSSNAWYSLPVQSKPVPILHPSHWEQQSRPTTKSSTAKNHLDSVSDGYTESETSIKATYQPSFDVYVRPFVPEALTVINKLHGVYHNTPASKQINFAPLVHGFVGTQVLPPMPTPMELTDASLPPLDTVTYTSYELCFRHQLEAEIQSQQLENESHSIYGHDVSILSHQNGQTICSFNVAGLRENAPYVEEDDIIDLRQLSYDLLGRPFGMDAWLAPNKQPGRFLYGFDVPGGRSRGEPAPGWTNNIYNSRVSAVQRKEGKLIVSVKGLPPPPFMRNSQQHPSHVPQQSKFNIQFPVSKERYAPSQTALAIVQHGLTHAIRIQLRHEHKQVAINTADSLLSVTPSAFDEPRRLEVSSETWIRSMLFPVESDCEIQTNLNTGYFERKFFDKQLNYEQMKATESICLQNYGTLPFLISGPPGTGKTKTLVEICLQIADKLEEVSHILICAPSDPAADIILQRLTFNLKSNELLRLNRPTRTFAEVPGGVLPFCYVTEDKFNLPPFRQLMAYKVVVTTCRDASLLLHARMTNSDLYTAEYSLRSVIHPYTRQAPKVELHWTALLMDESAQAIEPEALIPLTIVAPPLESVKLGFTPLVVMVGDEHQLGPRTSLSSTPLKISLFARLFARPVYADHPLARNKQGTALPALKSAMLPINRPPFANLIRNYRSHPAILAVPSALFYADTLEPEATGTDRLASWSKWQGRQWPVLFHDNNSEDELEMDGGGWYNIGEAQIACDYAASLVQSGLVEQKEVCIMSPFKAQVNRLRKTIREQRYGALWDVDIGPMEAFQGLEQGVVILCTTRSKQRFVDQDKEVDWGVIGLPNKMNVALTRAKFGLIVIGRRHILDLDLNWKVFLGFCGRNGLVAGAVEGKQQPLNKDLTITRLEKVLLSREPSANDSRALKGSSQEDEMWNAGMQATLDFENRIWI
jgi:hypothetical protein